MKNKILLITGGAGAIGVNLVSAFKEDAKMIIVVDDLSSGNEKFIPKTKNVKFIKESIVSERLYRRLQNYKIDYILHLAAHFANQNSIDNPQKDLKVNGEGTLKLLEYANKNNIKKFIYTSSSCVYGSIYNAKEGVKITQLDTPYAITKLLGEHYVRFYNQHYGLDTTILRIFNSFGPGELAGKYRNVIPNFIDSAIKGNPLIITGTGNETRDFTWVGNIIQAFNLVIKKDSAYGQTFNIGSGLETTINEIAKIINEFAGNRSKIKYTSKRKWDHISKRKACIEKAKLELGYNPDLKLKKYLRETYKWYMCYLSKNKK